jgi:hypothetical protein
VRAAANVEGECDVRSIGLAGTEGHERGWHDVTVAGTRQSRLRVSIVAVAAGLTSCNVVFAPTASGRGAPGANSHYVKAFMTLYGWVDNSPPGPGIAHPCLHPRAGGTGTFADPVTFATDVRESPWCQVIYVPFMKRYFVHEDECSECDRDWIRLHKYRFDMWAGGDARSPYPPERGALLRCESRWTRGNSINDPANPMVVVDPPANLPVTTAPIFSPPTTCWAGR